MSTIWAVPIAIAIFAATHLVLGLPPTRDALVRHLGEPRFVALFSAVAALTLAIVATALALYGDVGIRAPISAPWRVILAIISVLGWVLAILGLMNYARSPMSLFRTTIRPPSGVECITRHPFFVGFGLFALAHSALASTSAIASFFLGFGVIALIGAALQDWKLTRKWGGAYRDYCRQTSYWPFLAMFRGVAPRSALGRQWWFALAATALMFAAHPWLSAANGAAFVAAFALGGVYASWRRWRHSQTRTGH